MLADRLILGSTTPGLSKISFSRVWNNLQWSRLSFQSSSFQSLPFSKGPWPLQNRGSCPSLVQHFHRVANTPQTEGSTDSGFKSPHHLIYFLWVIPETPITVYWYKHTAQQKLWALFIPLDVTVDLQSHCPEMSPFILSSFLSWTGASQRFMDQSPLVCEHHVSPLLVAPHLMFCHIHLCVCSGQDPCTHTHTHMQHKHTRVRDRDTNGNREHKEVNEELLVHTKSRDFHISYRKFSILVFKCELYQSPTSMKER